MKIYLDDIRDPEDTYKDPENWITVRSYNDFIKIVDENYFYITTISLDHDLGLFEDREELTGYDCVKWLCDYIWDNERPVNFYLEVHSANPVGKENILSYWRNFLHAYHD